MYNRIIALAAAAVPIMLRAQDERFTMAIPFDSNELKKYMKTDIRGFTVGRARPKRSAKQAKPAKRSNRKTLSYRTKAKHKRAA